MFKWLALLLLATPAAAQSVTPGGGGGYNTFCVTQSVGTNNNTCGSTAFVQSTLVNFLATANNWSALQTFSAHVSIEGVTSTGATGSGSIVFAASPVLTTPSIGVATGTSVQTTGGFYSTSTSSFTFTDGVVLDYATGNARISTGAADTLSFYNGGIANTLLGQFSTTGNFKPAAGYSNVNLAISATAPTISSGFGTSPSVVANNGTAAFTVNVGTGGTASSGVVGLPTATNGWACNATDITTKSTSVFLTKQTASSTTSATFTNYNTAGAATAWVASDILSITCVAY